MTKLLETIGKSKLVQLKNIGNGKVFVKVEKSNPAGSVKDRAALYMIKGAIEDGSLKEGMEIVEPTSGNTGIAIAMIGRAFGYKVNIIMPSSMSVERRNLIESFGANLILTGEGGMQTAVDKAKELVATGNYFMPNQFENKYNAVAHEETTGPEIYKELKDISGFIAGIGTGGTVTGVGRYLKSQNKDIKIWGLEPEESPLLTKGEAGPHKIQGLGANFIPKVLDKKILDKTITVPSEKAIKMAKRLSREEGLSVGISSGANVLGALKMQKEIGGNIVTVAPDTAERYMSTDLFKNE
ncbi:MULTISPECIES: cysteine synthase A [Peptoniphilus]|jgi:cysteine synthase A|uniref:cysteine synthase A n=1 Tax=Peptoniphilus TaxID=162289 RepID=UPI0002885255|nr:MULTISPECIES: cysteine synthase A [Peptoniphilus]MBS6611314.1 cysteine synthase A [Peptoniphilus harei]MDU1955402.1 cysteine synthase A [Peptoniphilus lacydonensis]MDU2115017.1 cysteine synthase A [Peptoniphilus lacydonensis]MDU5275684.1 cysteine synthase A [Peptoniphilus lacydonensis]MDU5378026.1 cysteine synthase A [Peptoniphilus lacydonensis]